MRRLFFAPLTLLLAGLVLSAADAPKSAFDKPTLEAYIRHLFVLPAQLTVTVNDPKAVELGVKFTSSQSGEITGIRFYKGPQNTGTHVADLWSATGTLLGPSTSGFIT